MTIPLKRTDPEVIKAYAAGARDKLGDAAFAKAIVDLHQQWVGELMLAKTEFEQRELIAQLKALQGVAQRLNSMAADAQFAQRGDNVRKL